MDNPKLIEPNVRSHLLTALRKCRIEKETFDVMVFNIFVFVSITLIIGTTLYYCRKRKLTPFEQSEKQRKEQDYILSKIRQYQTAKIQKPITNLPFIS